MNLVWCLCMAALVAADHLLLKVMTFNVWGLSIAPDRALRLQAILSRLQAGPAYDVIVLQELWMRKDYELLRDGLAERYPHTVYFYSGCVGSGLATLSRWPIVETQFLRYAISGRADSPHQGDWYAGKGAALTHLQHPELGRLLIFNTHLVANYHDHVGNANEFDPYELQRIMQTVEYVRFIKQVARGHPEALCLAMGDWNEEEGSLAWQLAVEGGLIAGDQRLESVWSSLKAAPSDRLTFNHPRSVYWRPDKAPQQIDHILMHFQKGQRRLEVVSAGLAFDEPVTELGIRRRIGYSDHFALQATLRVQEGISRGQSQKAMNHQQAIPPRELERQLERVVAASLQELKWQRQRYLLLVGLSLISLTVILPMALVFMWPRRGLGRLSTLCLALLLPAITAGILISWWMGLVEYWEEVSAIRQFLQEMSLLIK